MHKMPADIDWRIGTKFIEWFADTNRYLVKDLNYGHLVFDATDWVQGKPTLRDFLWLLCNSTFDQNRLGRWWDNSQLLFHLDSVNVTRIDPIYETRKTIEPNKIDKIHALLNSAVEGSKYVQ